MERNAPREGCNPIGKLEQKEDVIAEDTKCTVRNFIGKDVITQNSRIDDDNIGKVYIPNQYERKDK